MVDVSLGSKLLKMPFLLLAFLVTLKWFDTKRGHLKDKRKSSHNFMFPKAKPHLIFKCIDKDAWNLCPVYNKAFYVQTHCIPTIEEYRDILISHDNGQRFSHFGSSSLREHIQ